MKTLILVVLAALGLAIPVLSQEQVTNDASESTAESTTARILGTISDGTPPPLAQPKPEYEVSASDVLSTTTHQQGGRTITIRQIKPIALPPPLPPAPLPTPEQEAAFREQIADYTATHSKSGILFASATIFRSQDSPPRTLVRYWPEGGGKSITLWSSADFALIAGGINSFEDSAGDTHHLLMGWGYVDLDRMANLYAASGREYEVPAMPGFPEGEASFAVTGDPPAAEGLVPIQSLHDLYNQNHARLVTAFQGREQARIAREEELRLHPPQPKNITLNFWRTEKPALAKGGAK